MQLTKAREKTTMIVIFKVSYYFNKWRKRNVQSL